MLTCCPMLYVQLPFCVQWFLKLHSCRSWHTRKPEAMYVQHWTTGQHWKVLCLYVSFCSCWYDLWCLSCSCPMWQKFVWNKHKMKRLFLLQGHPDCLVLSSFKWKELVLKEFHCLFSFCHTCQQILCCLIFFKCSLFVADPVKSSPQGSTWHFGLLLQVL